MEQTGILEETIMRYEYNQETELWEGTYEVRQSSRVDDDWTFPLVAIIQVTGKTIEDVARSLGIKVATYMESIDFDLENDVHKVHVLERKVH